MEKYESMLNLKAEIRIQRPELAFRDEHLVNFLLVSMPSTYESIIDNLNMRDVLALEKTVRALHTKETELTDLGIIKEESAHFAARGGFRGERGGRGGAGARTISRTPDAGYAVSGSAQRTRSRYEDYGPRMYLHRGGKTVMTGSRIGHLWLMNSVNCVILGKIFKKCGKSKGMVAKERKK